MVRPKKKTKRAKPSGIAAELRESFKEAVEWARGERELPVRTYRRPARTPVA
jgi:hypothetical protein